MGLFLIKKCTYIVFRARIKTLRNSVIFPKKRKFHPCSSQIPNFLKAWPADEQHSQFVLVKAGSSWDEQYLMDK
jgi:hypothetical protein